MRLLCAERTCNLAQSAESHSSEGCPPSPGVQITVSLQPRQSAGSTAGSTAESAVAVSSLTFVLPVRAIADSLRSGTGALASKRQ